MHVICWASANKHMQKHSKTRTAHTPTTSAVRKFDEQQDCESSRERDIPTSVQTEPPPIDTSTFRRNNCIYFSATAAAGAFPSPPLLFFFLNSIVQESKSSIDTKPLHQNPNILTHNREKTGLLQLAENRTCSSARKGNIGV